MSTPGLTFSTVVTSNDDVHTTPDGPRAIGLEAAAGSTIGLKEDALLVRLPAVTAGVAVGKTILWVGTVQP